MLRKATLLLALAAAACEPDVSDRTNPTSLDVALFSPQPPITPTPNDIARQLVATTPGPTGTTVNILFARQTPQQDGTTAFAPVTLAGVGTATSPTVGLPPGVVVVPIVPPGAPVTDFASVQTQLQAPVPATALTLIKSGGPWAANTRYAVVVRSGPNGLRTDQGDLVASPVTYFVTQDHPLDDPARPSPLPTATPEQVALLEQVRTQAIRPVVLALIALGVIESPEEIVSVQSFTTGP